MEISIIVALLVVNYVQVHSKPSKISSMVLKNGANTALPVVADDSSHSLSAELAQIEAEIEQEMDKTGTDSVTRDKRTTRLLNRVFCTFFRSSNPSCGTTLNTETPGDSMNDDFWLDYLNSNGTSTVTTTTERPTGIFGRKTAYLRNLFSRLFGGRSANSSGGSGLEMLSRLFAGPLRFLMRLREGRLGASAGTRGGYSNADVLN